MIRDRPLPHEGLVISVEPGGATMRYAISAVGEQ